VIDAPTDALGAGVLDWEVLTVIGGVLDAAAYTHTAVSEASFFHMNR
jgi:hypothetical protein